MKSIYCYSKTIENSIVLLLVLLLIFHACTPDIEKKQKEYQDITGFWKEYIIKGEVKDATALRKIEVNSKGKLEQSSTIELGSQCRIWLNDDDITFKDGHLSFWDNELYGDMSEDKLFIPLVYRQMDKPFLLERVKNPDTIRMMDSLVNCMDLEYTYHVPEQFDDGWDCTGLENVNIDQEKITAIIEDIKDGDYDDTHSLLIVRYGKLVLEEYFAAEGQISGPYVNEIYRDRIQNLASVTKSFTSALIGIAIDQGYIEGIDVPVYKYFPEYDSIKTGGREKILIKHLLSMSAGLQWNELDVSYTSRANDAGKMERSDDLIGYVFSKPMVADPGTEFSYSTGISMVLGEIIKRVTAMEANKFAEETLFKSLVIENYRWPRRRLKQVATGGGLSVCARDMAKFGQTYLDNGKWMGRQIIPEEWVVSSITSQIKRSSGAYGYQWWLRNYNVKGHTIESFYAIGNAGQFIVVIPSLDLVVVSTAQNYGRGWSKQFFRMLEKNMLPAVMNLDI